MEGSEGRRELMGRVVLLGKWKGRSLRRLMRDEGLSVLRRRGGRQRSIGPVVTLHRMGTECGQEVRHCQCGRAVADSGGSLLNTEPSILVSSPHMELIRSIDKATNKVSNSPPNACPSSSRGPTTLQHSGLRLTIFDPSLGIGPNGPPSPTYVIRYATLLNDCWLT